jgi:two-component system cell cycle response regulator
LLDIDHFKKVNDAHGHHIGDEVLRWLSRLVMAQARETDFVARYGGEEFVVIMPSTRGDDAFRFTQRLVKTVAALRFDGAKKASRSLSPPGWPRSPRRGQRRGNDPPVGRGAVRRQKRGTQPCEGL